MKISKGLMLLGAVVLATTLLPRSAKADSLTLTGVYGTVQGGIYTSPYYATFDGAQNTMVVCDDFVHDENIGDSWDVTVSTFPTLTNARFEHGLSSQLADYERIAWLIDQLVGDPTHGANISYAIWAVFNPGQAESWPGGWTSGYMYSAQWWYDQSAGKVPDNLSSFLILTPSNPTWPQEFITMTVPTPEPSSLLMLGLGLIGAAAFARYKKFGYRAQEPATEKAQA